MKRASGWLWGGVLIALGVVLGINALGIADINIFFPGWWTLFIIVPSAIGLFSDEHKSGPVAGLIVGVCLLLACLDVLSFGILWKLLLPFILIMVGLTVMVRSTSNGAVADRINKARRTQAEERRNGHKVVEGETIDDADGEDDEDEHDNRGGHRGRGAHEAPDLEEYWSTFSDQQVDYKGKTFTGCRVDAVFGGADIDLRGAKIKNESIVKVSSIFGGIIIYVPDDVKVEVASTAIFGGVSDKRKDSNRKKKSLDEADKDTKKVDNSGKTLYIDATCVFGGVEIR